MRIHATRFAPLSFGVTALVAAAPQGLAQPTKAQCFDQFIMADKDRNGVIEQREDEGGLHAAMAQRGVATVAKDAIARDEFIKACEAGVFESAAKSGAPDHGSQATTAPAPQPGSASDQDRELPKDLGKGDITPAPKALAEEEARSRLRANGFADVEDLALDKEGVWRGTAVVNGKRVAVAVDGQGDIIGGR